MVLGMENPESDPKFSKKRKRPLSETMNVKLEGEKPLMKLIKKGIKSAPPVLRKRETILEPIMEEGKDKKKEKESIPKEINERYPILRDEQLVQRFLTVSMTNNQKGRIRQLLRDSLKGTSEFLLPDVIHNRMQAIIRSNPVSNLTETELRKIRILYNMLKTAVSENKSEKKAKKPNKAKNKTDLELPELPKKENTNDAVPTKTKKIEKNDKVMESKVQNLKVEKKQDKVKSEDKVVKVKGPKRYVVFVGNLPPDIDKEKIMNHFKEFNECIVDIRIPKRPEGKKSSIAYVELRNEPSYELALSKHHSMLGNKRINVLYTTQKNGKVTKIEAKSKSAKLIAMQKAGKLIGSIPVNRKRSHRRMKMKRAQAKLAAESV